MSDQRGSEDKLKALLGKLEAYGRMTELTRQEMGLRILKDMFGALGEIKDVERIDSQPVVEFQAYTDTGFTQLLQAMHLGTTDNRTFYGPFANAVRANDAEDACSGWVTILNRQAPTIFFLIDRLQSALTKQEENSMQMVVLHIRSFMRLFDIHTKK